MSASGRWSCAQGTSGPEPVSAAPEFEPFRADPATLILPMTDLHRTAAS